MVAVGYKNVIKFPAPAKRRERLIEAHIHRHARQPVDDRQRHVRSYVASDNAIAAMSHWMYRFGRPGDVCEIVHSITKLQIATLKLTFRNGKCRLVVNAIFDQE